MEVSQILTYVGYFVAAIVTLIVIFGSFFTIRTSEAGIIERLGKFHHVATAGLNLKIPLIDAVKTIDLQVQQMTVSVETKTKDNVFVHIPVSIQYFILVDKIYDAFYRVANPAAQIQSYVFNTILGHVPKMTLDEAFLEQSQIALDVKKELESAMSSFGYGIVKALVTDVIPDETVKAAMNDINAAQRSQEAAKARGEAEKILKVKQAEAEADSKALQGRGIADQRKAIINGLRESVEAFKESVEGATAQDVMALVMTTQYFDTLKEIGASGKASTIFVQHSPDGGSKVMQEVANGILAAAAGR